MVAHRSPKPLVRVRILLGLPAFALRATAGLASIERVASEVTGEVGAKLTEQGNHRLKFP